METNRLKRFATEARNILMQGVAHRLTALGFEADGTPTEEPQLFTGGATFMGDTVSEDFYQKWQSLNRAIKSHGMKTIAEEAAYTWFNRLVAIRIMVKNGFITPILQYESEGVHVPLLVTEARQGRLPLLNAYDERRLIELLDDDSKTTEQFQILIVAFCHQNPIINKCFGQISDYTELLLPSNILADGGFIDMLNNTPFIAEEDYKSAELIGWLYQFYISEKKDDVFASFKAGKKAEAEDIPAATQIFTPNWIVKYMAQNTLGRIYLDNNPYDTDIKEKMQYLVEPSEPTPEEAKFKYESLEDLRLGDLACGSGHILNEFFDLMYLFYIENGYSRRNAIENIFLKNLTGVDLDTRAKQLSQFALMLKACQKDPSFLDARVMPNVLDMPTPLDMNMVKATLPEFFLGGNMKMLQETEEAFELLQQAENLGSIMKFNISDSTRAAIEIRLQEWEAQPTETVSDGIKALLHSFRLILALTQNYSALVMNPPYMGNGNMNAKLSDYTKHYYFDSKADLATVFVEMMSKRIISKGFFSFIIPPSWMFLPSFEKFRISILAYYQINSFLHLSNGAFGGDFGSTPCVIQNFHTEDSQGTYFRIVEKTFQYIEASHLQKIFQLALKDDNFKLRFDLYDRTVDSIKNDITGNQVVFKNVSQNVFSKIPGLPLSYWLSDRVVRCFENTTIKEITISDGQTKTGDNNKYLRLIWEVSADKIGKTRKWVKHPKGGAYRRWYGNIEWIVDWSDEARAFYRADKVARILPEYLWWKRGISWTLLTSGMQGYRDYQDDCIFNLAAPTLFFKDENERIYVLGLLNTPLSVMLIAIFNPTINNNIGDIQSIPLIKKNVIEINKIVHSCVNISKIDWDAHETSWDFETNPLLKCSGGAITEEGKSADLGNAPDLLKNLFDMYKAEWEKNFMQLHSNEEELNRQFIEIYGLQDELTPDVPLDEITILQQGEISIEDNHIVWHPDVIMKQLISYAVGCLMGRYSLDKDGLILANQGDGLKQFHELVTDSKFEPDDDGIIPLMSAQSDFADNATVRFKQWLAVAFGEETLVENLNFIEASLGKSIDDYFVKDFWKDHKKMYQNRPIYWLFSSKKGAFQCLTYMHRMDAYTAERVRTKYLLPHIEWLLQKQNELNDNLINLSSQERRELDNITKQIQECREYHDRLHVVADHQIGFDLDDGVVVNYAKFGDVLANIK